MVPPPRSVLPGHTSAGPPDSVVQHPERGSIRSSSERVAATSLRRDNLAGGVIATSAATLVWTPTCVG